MTPKEYTDQKQRGRTGVFSLCHEREKNRRRDSARNMHMTYVNLIEVASATETANQSEGAMQASITVSLGLRERARASVRVCQWCERLC